MKALAFEGPRKLAHEGVPVLRCGPDEVLLEVSEAPVRNCA